MRRPEAGRVTLRVLLCALLCLAATARADEPAYRFKAPIVVDKAAPFVQLPLPASAYARSAQAALADLRIVDARGERVPFAVLAPRAAEVQSIEQQRDALLYALPARPAAGGEWASPVEVTVQGERLSVRRLPGARAPVAGTRSGGWLIDLGERRRDDPPPQSLRLQWSGPAEFSAAYRCETSDDLRSWRAGGAGQLLALAGAGGPLTQPTVALPAHAGRFVRLLWADPAAAPAVTGAKVVAATLTSTAVDAPVELVFAASPEPSGKLARDEAAARSLHFDLGGVLPLQQIELRWPSGTQVAPLRVQGRDDRDQAWRDLAAGVAYRLERGAEVSVSPPMALQARARYLRVVPDVRAAPLDAGQARLVLQAPLASLVFATQGPAPYALWAGAPGAATSALPVASLVPALDDERARFGRATLGAWQEVEAVAAAARTQQQLSAWRPWLLWAVLLAGVGGLAFMVWRLTRSAAPRQAPGP